MRKFYIEDINTYICDKAAAANDPALVFWPNKLYGLAQRLGDDRKSLQNEKTLLVGKVISDHLTQASFVVYGLVPVKHVPALQQHGVELVGVCQDQEEEGIKSNHAPFITAILAKKPSELPLSVSVSLPSADGESSLTATILKYTVPNSRMLQYYALEPLRLGPVSGMKLIDLGTLLFHQCGQAQFSDARRRAYGPTALERKFFDLMLLDPARWRELKTERALPSFNRKGSALDLTLIHINQMQPLLQSIITPQEKQGRKDEAPADFMSRVATPVEMLLSCVKTCLNYRIGSRADARPSLSSLLASAHQLDTRVSQLLIAPRLASRLRQMRKSREWPTDEIAAPYIGLWNSIWLIANDVILGHVLSLLLLHHKTKLAKFLEVRFEQYFVQSVHWLLAWLGDWPAGLKLNTELSLFFGDAYSALTDSWNQHFLSLVLPRLELVIVIFAMMGRIFGVTMVLCLVQDLMAICTLHITAYYLLSLQTMRFFVHVFSALFDLFRGKKRNALRGGRLDNASYELDQLLLGTTLFTLVAFLFPTVYVYYLAFGLVRLSVVGFEVAVTETCLGLLNHLPLFALMLRIKDPHRLPAGIVFDEEKPHPKQHNATGRYRMRSTPMSWSSIFEGYADHVGGLAALPGMLLRCLLGQPLRRG